jgi:hypothetical protein
VHWRSARRRQRNRSICRAMERCVCCVSISIVFATTNSKHSSFVYIVKICCISVTATATALRQLSVDGQRAADDDDINDGQLAATPTIVVLLCSYTAIRIDQQQQQSVVDKSHDTPDEHDLVVVDDVDDHERHRIVVVDRSESATARTDAHEEDARRPRRDRLVDPVAVVDQRLQLYSRANEQSLFVCCVCKSFCLCAIDVQKMCKSRSANNVAQPCRMKGTNNKNQHKHSQNETKQTKTYHAAAAARQVAAAATPFAANRSPYHRSPPPHRHRRRRRRRCRCRRRRRRRR